MREILNKHWYKIDGKWVHYTQHHLDGRHLSPQEVYEFEAKNFDILYPKSLWQKIISFLE